MHRPDDYELLLIDAESGGELELAADDPLFIASLDKWGNDWDGLYPDDDIDIHLIGD